MKIIVAGTGSIGRRHVDNLRRLVPTASFVVVRRSGASDAYSDSIGARVYADFEAALADGAQLAVIGTPSTEHAAPVIACLRAGVATYVEKPVVATRGQLEHVGAALAAIRPPPTLAGCVLRFLPSVLALRSALRSGRIGRPVRATLQVGQWLPSWRPAADYRRGYSARAALGGGVVLDLVHELDMARFLFGEFDEVAAVGGRFSSLDIDAEDSAVIALSRAGGPAVAVGLDYVARRPLRRYEIVGDEGTLTWDLRARSVTLETEADSEVLAEGAAAFDTGAAFVTAMAELLGAVHAGAPSTSQDLAEGLRSAALAIRCNELLRSPRQ